MRKRTQQERADTGLNYLFFLLGGIAAVWLALLLFRESFQLGWGNLWFSVVFWVLLAYLVLPRLHRILTRIYVPDYFIGRARTSDGLLGDPINLALLGSEPQVHAAMRAAGWLRADDLTLGSGRRIVSSVLFRRSYLRAPVSPLLLFGRQQDFAYQQEVDDNPGRRHHVRFWRCPPDWKLPGGYRVDWLAAGTYDRSVGFSLFTLQITHKIDERTDAERDHIVSSITEADAGASVAVIRDFSAGYHARNGGGDAIVTDGDLPMVDLRAVAAPDADASSQENRFRRPAPLIVGFVLLLARALTSLLVVAAIAVGWSSFRSEIEVSGVSPDDALWLVVIAYSVLAVGELVLAWLVFSGHNWARLLTMAISAVVLAGQAALWADGSVPITFRSNLVGVSLDILLILALSSERALAYARRRRGGPAATQPFG